MTVIVGMHLRDFVRLAADTRTVWTDSAADKILLRDDRSLKFQDIGIGLMTGSRIHHFV